MSKSNKPSSIWLILIILLVIITAFFISFFSFSKSPQVIPPIALQGPTPPPQTISWPTFSSDELGITFKLPQSFYWNGGRSTGGEGPFFKPFTLGKDTSIVINSGKVSCNLTGKYLKKPSSCIQGMNINYLLAQYSDVNNPHAPIFLIGANTTPTIDPNIYSFRYDDDIIILGVNHKVRIYYEKNSNLSPARTYAITIEGEVLANQNSKWKTFDMHPFIGFQDEAFTPPGSGLSQTSRIVISTLKYQ